MARATTRSTGRLGSLLGRRWGSCRRSLESTRLAVRRKMHLPRIAFDKSVVFPRSTSATGGRRYFCGGLLG
jgi:hypothetical protein